MHHSYILLQFQFLFGKAMLTCGGVEDKVHAKETLRQGIGQTEQCTITDNIDIYSSDSSTLYFIVASGIGDILFLFSDIFTLSEREESHLKAFLKLDRSLPFWTVLRDKIMSTMHNICTSPTKLSSIILAILAMFLYAISPDTESFWVCFFVLIVPMMAFVMIYEICSTRRSRGIERSSSVNHLIGCDELHHSVPSYEAFPTKRRLQELRHQIALLNREIDEFENFTLRELPSLFNVFGIPYMTEEEINALLVHNYKDTGIESEDSLVRQASSSSASAKEFCKIDVMDEDRSCDQLKCGICLEQVIKGDPVYSFPCLHQFHSRCIDPFLGLNACPICELDSDDGMV